MILEFIIKAFLSIASFLLSIFRGALPMEDINTILLGAFNVFSEFLTMSGQFCNFMLGDYLKIILPILFPFLVYKYIGYPIISFLRGFVRWGS